MRCSVATEVSRDVGIIGRAGVRDRFSVPMFETDLGVSIVCLPVSLIGVVFLELGAHCSFGRYRTLSSWSKW